MLTETLSTLVKINNTGTKVSESYLAVHNYQVNVFLSMFLNY